MFQCHDEYETQCATSYVNKCSTVTEVSKPRLLIGQKASHWPISSCSDWLSSVQVTIKYEQVCATSYVENCATVTEVRFDMSWPLIGQLPPNL